MFFEVMKKTADFIQVNTPTTVAMLAMCLTDVESLVKIGVGIVGAICTILITRQKLKQKDKE